MLVAAVNHILFKLLLGIGDGWARAIIETPTESEVLYDYSSQGPYALSLLKSSSRTLIGGSVLRGIGQKAIFWGQYRLDNIGIGTVIIDNYISMPLYLVTRQSLLSGLPRLRINVWACFGVFFLALFESAERSRTNIQGCLMHGDISANYKVTYVQFYTSWYLNGYCQIFYFE